MNPHQKPQEDVVVTQEDRNAAAQHVAWLIAAEQRIRSDAPFFHVGLPDGIRRGIWDDHEAVQAFARHRLLGHEAGRRDMREAAGWQPIETCSTWQHGHMRTMLAFWNTRGVCETYWDEDDDFDTRTKRWISPREGWRSPGDMCIPVNQDAVTHWMPKPAPPALPTEPLGGEGKPAAKIEGEV